MAPELSFRAEAAAGCDRALSHVSAHFLLFLLRAATQELPIDLPRQPHQRVAHVYDLIQCRPE
jgi:hypothetical protein